MTAEQAIEFLKFYETTIPKEPPIETIIDKEEKDWYHDNEELLEVINMAIKSIEENEYFKKEVDRARRSQAIVSALYNNLFESHENLKSAIKKAREEIEKRSDSEYDIYNEYADGRVDGLDTALEILDKHLGEINV